jgi:Ca-activated chloride channel family protein
MVRAQASALSADVVVGHELLQRGQGGTLDVLIRLCGADAPEAERPPLDLALVVDRSGSMAGDKLQAVKQAALDVVGRLEQSDRVTLISYETEVNVHCVRVAVDETGIPRLRREILGLEDAGSTALGPALFRALELLETDQREPDVLAHVMMLSDGLANVGEQRPEIIAARAARAFESGLATSTLGVGLDYNEDLMTRVADDGGGRYHFIEGPQAIPDVLAGEFAGLVATVARGVELEITPPDGFEVVEVFGYANTRTGPTTTARIGSLAAGQSREVVVRLRHPAARGRSLSLGDLTVRFFDARDQGRPDALALRPAVGLTDDAAAARQSERTEVTVRVAELEAAHKLRLATDAVGDGRYEHAKDLLGGAIGRLREQVVATPSEDLEAQIGEMIEAADRVDEARHSAKERKLYQKSFRHKAYKKGKK